MASTLAPGSVVASAVASTLTNPGNAASPRSACARIAAPGSRASTRGPRSSTSRVKMPVPEPTSATVRPARQPCAAARCAMSAAG